MPVQIGAKTHSFNDPTGLLSDCHRRIEMFMLSLEAVADAIGTPPNDETRRALETALTYFREAAPKHTADEEESLFPRLRGSHSPELETAFSQLDALEVDHRWAEPLHAELDRLGREYLSHGQLSPADAQQFRSAVAQLASMYRRHIAVEDNVLFPAAAKVLADSDRRAIAEEMARRRVPKAEPGSHNHRA